MRAKAANASLYTNVAQFVLSLCLAMPRRPHAWALRAHVGQTARHGRPRAPRFTRGASGGELCAAYSHLRAVGWGLVHPKVGALYSFSFEGRKYSRRATQQTSLRHHRNGRGAFGAVQNLLRARLLHVRVLPRSIFSGIYSPASAGSVIAASRSPAPTSERTGASLGRLEREKQR